jgi:hypothetical protein
MVNEEKINNKILKIKNLISEVKKYITFDDLKNISNKFLEIENKELYFLDLEDYELLALNNLIVKKCDVSLIINETSLIILNQYYTELYSVMSKRYQTEFNLHVAVDADMFVKHVLNDIKSINKDIKYFLIYILIDTYKPNSKIYEFLYAMNIKDIYTIVPSFRIYTITEMHVFAGFKDINLYFNRPFLEIYLTEYLIAEKIFNKYLETIDL